jgi:putative ubiquitin-RnfH superfamily antitoxin RatB of RatAB toxin-antitoxin module
MRQPFICQEGIMAGPDFPLSINRRRLMTAAAAVTASGVLPGVKRAALTLEVEPGNFCAATARRLVEIALRNELRQEVKLPLLSVPKELRRMKKQEELEEFDRFEAAYGKAVWEEVLKPRREAEGNPTWRPSWMEGVACQTQVNKILWEQFYAARRAGSSVE